MRVWLVGNNKPKTGFTHIVQFTIISCLNFYITISVFFLPFFHFDKEAVIPLMHVQLKKEGFYFL